MVNELTETWLRILTSQPDQIQPGHTREAIEALGRIGNPQAIEELLDIARSNNREALHEPAFYALAQICVHSATESQRANVVALFKDALKHDGPERWVGLRCLILMQESSTIPDLMAAFHSSEDKYFTEDIPAALLHIGQCLSMTERDEQLARPFCDWLWLDIATGNKALHAIASLFDDPRMVSSQRYITLRLLADIQEKRRPIPLAVLMAVEHAGNAWDNMALRQQLLGLFAQAVESLATESDSPQQLTRESSAAQEIAPPSDILEVMSAYYLHNQDPTVLGMLARLLQHPDPSLQNAAVQALIKARPTILASLLEQALERPDFEPREAVVTGLTSLGTVQAIMVCIAAAFTAKKKGFFQFVCTAFEQVKNPEAAEVFIPILNGIYYKFDPAQSLVQYLFAKSIVKALGNIRQVSSIQALLDLINRLRSIQETLPSLMATYEQRPDGENKGIDWERVKQALDELRMSAAQELISFRDPMILNEVLSLLRDHWKVEEQIWQKIWSLVDPLSERDLAQLNQLIKQALLLLQNIKSNAFQAELDSPIRERDNCDAQEQPQEQQTAALEQQFAALPNGSELLRILLADLAPNRNWLNCIEPCLTNMEWKPASSEAGIIYALLRHDVDACARVDLAAQPLLGQALHSVAVAERLTALRLLRTLDDSTAAFLSPEHMKRVLIVRPEFDYVLAFLVDIDMQFRSEGPLDRYQFTGVLNDWYSTVADTLSNCGIANSDVIQFLGNLLDYNGLEEAGSGEVHQHALAALRSLGGPHTIAILLDFLDRNIDQQSLQWGVLSEAASALDLLGWHPDQNKQAVTYWIARKEWKQCGQVGASAVPVLLRLARELDEVIWKGALVALGETHDSTAIEQLIAFLNDDQKRSTSAAALASAGPIAIEPLIELLTSTNNRQRDASVYATVIHILTQVALAYPQEGQYILLTRRFVDLLDNDETQLAVLNAISTLIGHIASLEIRLEVGERLLTIQRWPNEQTLQMAIIILVKIGPPVLSRLDNLLNRPDEPDTDASHNAQVRQTAISVLEHIFAGLSPEQEQEKKEIRRILLKYYRKHPPEQSRVPSTYQPKIFRVFVSSTFTDFIDERNLMYERVYPEVQRLCAQYGAQFQAIDLRWGISDEAVFSQQLLDICTDEIARCQKTGTHPNFLFLIGNRYGSRQVPSDIPPEEFFQICTKLTPGEAAFLNEWYWCDENADPPIYCLQPHPDRLEQITASLWNNLMTYDEFDSLSDNRNRACLERCFQRQGDEYELTAANDPDETYEHERIARFIAQESWNRLRKRLLQILKTAVDQLDLSEEQRLKYFASATHQEMYEGVLKLDDVFARRNVFGIIRDITTTDNLALVKSPLAGCREAGRYINLIKHPDSSYHVDEEAQQDLACLRDDARLTRATLYHYTRTFDGSTLSGGQELEDFRQVVLDYLSEAILADLLPRSDEVSQEVEAHTRFARERERKFTGRESVIETIHTYLQHPARVPLAILGRPGVGKSALLAHIALEAGSLFPGAVIAVRFIGATPGSVSVRRLLESVCHQISQEQELQEEEQSQGRVNELADRLKTLMDKATAYRPLVIIFDALDQLTDLDRTDGVEWLPSSLPEHVHIVVSSIPGDEGEYQMLLESHLPEESFLELEPMKAREGEVLLNRWLAQYKRRLQPAQREELLQKFAQNGLPLWLRLAFEQARHWKSYDLLPSEGLKPDVSGIIHDMLDWLEQDTNYGRIFVQHALGFLAASQEGLSEVELIDALSRDLEVYAWFTSSANQAPPDLEGDAEKFLEDHHLRLHAPTPGSITSELQKQWETLANLPHVPIVLWARLYYDLRPFMVERMAWGALRIAFFHRQFRRVIEKRYLDGAAGSEHHSLLANYYFKQGTWINGQSPNVAKAFELIYQQEKAAALQAERLIEALTDIGAIAAKCRAGLTDNLVQEYENALRLDILADVERQRVGVFAQLIGHRSDVLRNNPELFPQEVMNDPLFTPQQKREAQRLLQGSWLSWTNADAFGQERQEMPAGTAHAIAQEDRLAFLCTGSQVHVWDLESRELWWSPECNSVITALAVAHDGRYVVTGCKDGTILVWDLFDRRYVRTLQGSDSAVTALALLPTNYGIIVGCDDGSLALWRELQQTRPIKLAGHEYPVTGLQVDDKGTSCLSLDRCSNIIVWDLAHAAVRHRLDADIGQVVAASGSTDDMTVLCLRQGKAFLQCLSPRQRICQLEDPDPIVAGALTKDGRFAVTCSREKDYLLKRWDLATGRCINMTTLPVNGVVTLLALGDGQQVVILHDHGLDLYGFMPESLIHQFPQGYKDLDTIAISPDESMVAGFKNTLQVWSIASGECIFEQALFRDAKFPLTGQGAMSNQEVIVSGFAPTIAAYEIKQPHTMRQLEGHTGRINAIATTPEGHIISGSSDGTARVWDETGNCLQIFDIHRDEIEKAFVLDGQQSVLCSRDGLVSRWNSATGQCAATYEIKAGEILAQGVTPEGSYLALAVCSWRRLGIWDVNTGMLTYLPSKYPRNLDRALLSPDGRYFVIWNEAGAIACWNLLMHTWVNLAEHIAKNITMVTCQGDWIAALVGDGRMLDVWDARTGNLLWHTEPSPAVKFDSLVLSASGKLIAGSAQGCAQVWEVTDGHMLQRLQRYVYPSDMEITRFQSNYQDDNTLFQLLLTPDNQQAISVQGANSIRLWDMTTGKLKKERVDHKVPVTAMSLMADGETLLTGDAEGYVREISLRYDLSFTISEPKKGEKHTIVSITPMSDGSSYYSSGRISLLTPDAKRRVLTARSRGPLVVMDNENNKELASADLRSLVTYQFYTSRRHLALTSDGKMALLGGNGALYVWDLDDLSQPVSSIMGLGKVMALVIAKTDDFCVMACEEYGLQVLSLANLHESQQTAIYGNGHKEATDRKQVSLDKLVHLEDYENRVSCLAISPDSAYVAGGSYDHSVCVWSRRNGKRIAKFILHGPVASLAYTSDGASLACLDAQGQLYLLRLESPATLS